MAEQSLLIRIGIDPSGAVTGGKIVEGSLGGLDNRLSGLNQRFGEGAKVGVPFERMFTRMGTMPRIQVFNLLTQDLISATGGMGGLGQASALARTGLFAVQGVASTLLGRAGFGAVAVAGLLVVSMFTKKAEATKKAREELDKNLKSILANIDPLMELYKTGQLAYSEDRVTILKKINDAQKEIEKTANKIRAGVGDEYKTWEEARLAEQEQNAQKRLDLSKYKEKLQEIDAELKLQGVVVGNVGKVTLDSIWNSITKTKEYQDELKKLKVLAPKPEGSLLKAPKGLENISKGIEGFNEDVESSFDRLMESVRDSYKNQEKSAEMWKDAVRPYVSDVSSAFTDMMMGVDVRWGDLLESMVKQLIASGIQSLIMGLLTGGVGGGLLGGIFGGFQSGTPFVPRTGAYILHQGEAVIPANQNVYRSSVFNQQSNYGNTYVQIIQLDPKKLTKDKIAPILKEMIKNREFNI